MQYAERLPIGKESVIRNVPASTVKAFYQRWYRPEHMAVVVTGDFADADGIVDLVKQHMGSCQAAGSSPAASIPRCRPVTLQRYCNHCCPALRTPALTCLFVASAPVVM